MRFPDKPVLDKLDVTVYMYCTHIRMYVAGLLSGLLIMKTI